MRVSEAVIPDMAPNAAGQETARVSIVITCYNQGHFLADAIESALNQTAPPCEVIVVDDGSTDNTAEVARRYPGVRLIGQRNQGLSCARNAGIANSSGSHLMFLDADDRLLPNAITASLACFSQNPEAAFIYGDFRRINERGELVKTSRQVKGFADAYTALLRTNYIAMHGTVMYRREILEKAGGFDKRMRACEDYELFLRISRRFPVSWHSEVVAEVREHSSNMTRNSGRMLTYALKVLRAQKPFLDSPERRAAYESGTAFWRTLYGELLCNDLRLRAASWSGMLYEGLIGIRHYPGRLIERPVEMVKSRVRKLIPPQTVPGRPSWAPPIPRGAPRLNRVRWGQLRRKSPVSSVYGFDRGLPVDRYYIRDFLASHSLKIRGRVLEVGDSAYTHEFGGTRVTRADVLNLVPDAQTTICADLGKAGSLEHDAFDCIVITQTLQYVFELRTALENLHNALKPGGCVLASVPVVSRRDPETRWQDCWRMTACSSRRLFEDVFGAGAVQISVYGNLVTAIALLHGLAASELRADELEWHDPNYEVLIGVCAVKGAGRPE